jgi:carbon storage regulator
MLVLSRKRHESIVIGGCVGFERLMKLTVIRVCGGTVKIGFEVPDDIPVYRLELWERIRAGAKHDRSWQTNEASAVMD